LTLVNTEEKDVEHHHHTTTLTTTMDSMSITTEELANMLVNHAVADQGAYLYFFYSLKDKVTDA
jgi:hypothetical protein